jgi:hypothetical protein
MFHESPVGYGDQYIRPWGECHPDFEAHPIGHPEGVKVCTRRAKPPVPTSKAYRQNGLHRYRMNLYDPTIEKPIQQYNPDAPVNRRIPNENYLVTKDYISRDIRFNATGLEGLRTPKCVADSNSVCGRQRRFIQYANDWVGKPWIKTPADANPHISGNITKKKYAVNNYDLRRIDELQPIPIWTEDTLYQMNF